MKKDFLMVADAQQPEIIAPRPLSRLTYKIMSLNLLAIFMLIVGVAYLDQYREELTASETETISIETQLYAAILAESAFAGEKFEGNQAQKILESFIRQKSQEIRLFDRDGKLLTGHISDGTTSPVQTPIEQTGKLPGALGHAIEDTFARLVDVFAVRFNLPPYPKVVPDDYLTYPDVDTALEKNVSLSAWQSEKGGLILSSAAPIIKNNEVVGAVLVTRLDTNIEKTFASVRLDILKLFLLALTLTISISLYLAGAIGHPLRQLASAAEAIHSGRTKMVNIPDMSDRKDEIGELSQAMRSMTQALSERLDSIDRFAADVAHELKNPLTSLRSAFETLQKVKADNDRQRLNDIILHDLQRMDRLITDISQASRLDTELSRDKLAPLDLRDVLLPLIDMHRKPIERLGDNHEKSADQITYSGLGAPVMVLGQPVRLAQVFQNLISNALSFSPAGHPVRLTVEQEPDFVTIYVDDDGPGIPDSKLEKVFERFYSERPSSEAFGTHSGLGLSIVKQIIDVHGGTIHAENRVTAEGKKVGARFITKLKVPKI